MVFLVLCTMVIFALSSQGFFTTRGGRGSSSSLKTINRDIGTTTKSSCWSVCSSTVGSQRKIEECIRDCELTETSTEKNSKSKMMTRRLLSVNVAAKECLGRHTLEPYPCIIERDKVVVNFTKEPDKARVSWAPLKDDYFCNNWISYALIYQTGSDYDQMKCADVPKNQTHWTISGYWKYPETLSLAVVTFPYSIKDGIPLIVFDPRPEAGQVLPTFDSGLSTTVTTRLVASIGGGVTAGVVLITILLVAIMWRRRKLRLALKQDPGSDETAERYDLVSGSIPPSTSGRDVLVSASIPPSTSGRDVLVSASIPPSTSGRDALVSASIPPSTSGRDALVSASIPPSTSGRDVLVSASIPPSTSRRDELVSASIPPSTSGRDALVSASIPPSTSGRDALVSASIPPSTSRREREEDLRRKSSVVTSLFGSFVSDHLVSDALSSLCGVCLDVYYSCYYPENEAFRHSVAAIVNTFRENGYDVMMDLMASREISSEGPGRWAERQIRRAKNILVFLSPGLVKLSLNDSEGIYSQDITRVWIELELLRELYARARSAARIVCIVLDDFPINVRDLPLWAKVCYKWPEDFEEILKRMNNRPSVLSL